MCVHAGVSKSIYWLSLASSSRMPSCHLQNYDEVLVSISYNYLSIIIIAHNYCSHCKKRGVTEHPRGAIFYCFHGNPYCYHGNSIILLPWGVQLHRVFYSARTAFAGMLTQMQGRVFTKSVPPSTSLISRL